MKKMFFRMTALMVAMMMTMTTYAASGDDNNEVEEDEEWLDADTLAIDTTLWYNQTQQLGGIVVKGRLPKTRVKGDAMRTTVAGTILEKAGTVSDALSKIPQLKAERDGSVEVLGRGAAEVYINGRKVQDMKELSRLRSDQIQHVDVLQNPGARYAASTKAVVRITLKKAQGEGISFQDNAGGIYKYGHTLTNNLDVNYRTGGLDVTASFWAGRYGHHESRQDNDLTYYAGPDYVLGKTTQNTKNIWKGWSPQLQVNYMVNEKHSFGAYYKYDRHPSGDLTSNFFTDSYENGKFKEHSESHIWQDDNFRKHIFNAYYNGKVGKLGIDLNIDGLFDKTETPGSTTEQTFERPRQTGERLKPGGTTERTFESSTNSGNNFWATKLILSYPVWKGNLSLGGEYSYNHRTDAYSFTATYYNFGQRENEVCRDYGDWFPTATLSMPVGKMQMSLSYRHDIERPSYSNLTSSTIYLNRYAYQSGNPYLKPTYTHSLALNAAYQWANLTINYGRIKDVVTMSTEPYPGSTDPLVSLIRPINSTEDYDQLSFSLSARPTIGKWHPMWYVYSIFQNYKTTTIDGTLKTLNHPYLTLAWNNDIELPHAFRLMANMQWSSKGDYNNNRITCQRFNTTLGVQRDFRLGRMGSLTADVRCYDVFNTDKADAIIYGIRELTTSGPARRTFMLDLTWKFNEARSKYRGSGAGEKQKARM